MASAEDIKFCDILVALSPRVSKARDAIQTIVEELESGSMINWGNIRVILSKLYQNHTPGFFYQHCSAYSSRCPKTFKKFIFHILTLFDMHKCSDKSVIADVLELLYITKCYSNEYRIKLHTWTGMQSNEINNQRPMSVFEKTLISPYKDCSSILSSTLESGRMPCCNSEPYINSYISCCRLLCYNWIAMLAICGKVDILKIVISHGATLIIPFKWKKLAFIDTGYIKTTYFYVANLSHFENKLDFMELDERSRKRLYLVSTVLLIFFGNNFRSGTDLHIQCARIFINSTPEPLITCEEIKSFLTETCSGIFTNKQMLQLLETYESYFPESREASTPRSLEHLSRFQVRESLRTARSFPHGVESLGVPAKIQDLICLKDILL